MFFLNLACQILLGKLLYSSVGFRNFMFFREVALRAVGLTDVGKVREVNQDSFANIDMLGLQTVWVVMRLVKKPV